MSSFFDADSHLRWLALFGEGCSLLIHEPLGDHHLDPKEVGRSAGAATDVLHGLPAESLLRAGDDVIDDAVGHHFEVEPCAESETARVLRLVRRVRRCLVQSGQCPPGSGRSLSA